MSFNTFLTTINTHGIARTNRFEVNIIEISTRLGAAGIPDLIHYANSVTVPGRDIQTSRIQLSNKPMNLPTEFNFDQTVSVVYYIDSTHLIRKVFEEWMENVISPTDYTLNYHDEYVSDIYITEYDYSLQNPSQFEKEAPFKDRLMDRFKHKPEKQAETAPIIVATHHLINAYPVKIGAVNLSNDSRGEFMRLNVDLSYEKLVSYYPIAGQQLNTVNKPKSNGKKSVFDKMKDKLLGFAQDKALDAASTAGGIVKSLDPRRLF